VIYTLSSDGGELGGHSLARLEEIDMDLGYGLTKRHRIAETDPLSAKSELRQNVVMRRGGFSIRIQSAVRLAASSADFLFEAELEAFEGDHPVRSRKWDVRVPRRLL
jgi:hypothetical protein